MTYLVNHFAIHNRIGLNITVIAVIITCSQDVIGGASTGTYQWGVAHRAVNKAV
ncbi:5189_t:CDS:1, partial [Scutellospora calospora]